MGGQLSAHQKKEAITRLILNERTVNIEIIHRFSIHDAEHAAKQLFGAAVDILDDRTSQKQFADYVNTNFTMKRLSGKSLNLKTVGFEIEGRYIWIYQETPLLEVEAGFIIAHNALREIWPQQVNLLNIERKNQSVRSLIFKGATSEQRIEL